MFKIYQKERKISLLIVVCDSDGSTKCSDTNTTYPCTPSKPSPMIVLGSQVGSSQGCFISEQFDQFGDPNEYVGFDEEHVYGFDCEDDLHYDSVIQEVQINQQLILEENISEEPTIDDVVECEPIIAYDHENSKIEANALFSDVNAFRMTLRHFAIKNEFEISTVKSNKTRFIGKCKHSDCPW
jgi:MuDR family transposase